MSDRKNEVLDFLRSSLRNKGSQEDLESLEKRTRIGGIQADIGLRKWYGFVILGILGYQLHEMNTIFKEYGSGCLPKLTSSDLKLFVTGSLAEIFAIILVITKYLFKEPRPLTPDAEK